VKVELIRGLGSAALVLGTILQGLVTANQALGFPGSALVNTADIPGFTRTITGTTPAVGAEILETVPTGAIWELVSFNHTLQTGAGGGARTVRLVAMVAAALAINAAPVAQQGVATLGTYAWSNQLASQQLALGAGFYFGAPIPIGVVLPSGATIGTLTASLQADDQFAAVSYNVRERLLS
jgi:hypothetical protein